MQLPEVCMACMPTSARSARIRQFGELDPVELDVLPRGEMAVAAVVARAMYGQLRNCFDDSVP
jgi:hypothetical protein